MSIVGRSRSLVADCPVDRPVFAEESLAAAWVAVPGLVIDPRTARVLVVEVVVLPVAHSEAAAEDPVDYGYWLVNADVA